MSLPSNDSFSSFGGQKSNYAPPENPATDYDATLLNVALCDVAEMTRTALRGWVRITLAASTGALVLSDWEAVWKGGSFSPTVPTLVRTTTGVFTITFPVSIVDENGKTVTINLRRSSAQIEGNTFGFSQSTVTAANIITLYTANSGGSPNDLVGSVVDVEFA